MPRPQRIEYENAFYHVMNRGRGRKIIFHDEQYYQAFLDTVREAQRRFGCVIHAYCLMGNHYHLLIETPNANLGRVMRHVNGVYTQRYNRLKKTDGPLFRGRYKAVLVDCDAYLLRLSRYIHRNPIDMRRPTVSCLEDHLWSSYPAYIGRVKPSPWLEREMVYGMLDSKQRNRGYATYVMDGVDAETQQFYQKKNVPSIIGDKDFKAWVYDDLLPELKSDEKVRVIQADISIEDVIRGVASAYGVGIDDVTQVVKGPQAENEPRKIAMHLCQELSGAKLKEIAEYFNLGHPGSVSFTTCQVRKMKVDYKKMERKIESIIKSILDQVT